MLRQDNATRATNGGRRAMARAGSGPRICGGRDRGAARRAAFACLGLHPIPCAVWACSARIWPRCLFEPGLVLSRLGPDLKSEKSEGMGYAPPRPCRVCVF